MKLGSIWIGLMLLTLVPGLTTAQPLFAGEQVAHPPDVPAPKIESQLVPGEKFEDLPLAEVLQFIHEKMPEFNSVVVRAPGVKEEYPIIPRMSVKNVTIGQFLEFLRTSFPGVEIQRIEGQAGPLYVVKVTSGPMDQPNFPGVPPGFGGGVPGLPMAGAFPAGGMPPQPGPPGNVVQVYRLNDIVASLIAGKEGDPRDRSRGALTDILSLVQSALEESGEKENVVLKVHEQTQTMLFKGSPFKQAVLEQVLNTLRPTQDPIQTKELTELRDQVRVLQAQREIEQVRRDEFARTHEKEADEMRTRLREMQFKAEEMEAKNAQLQAQLEQARKQPR
jgi:hypothetical protein